MLDRDEQLRMGEAARRFGSTLSWDNVFEKVYAAYRECLATSPASAPIASVNV
jgi:hypothetical protein